MTIKHVELPPELKLKKLCFFVPEFRIWTGQTVLTETDFKLGKDGSLPPKGVLAELGMKNLVDPQTLNIFNVIKRRAIRRLDDAGVAWLNGYAIPLERAKEVMRKLDLEVQAFDEAVASFMGRYENLVEEWIHANPNFSEELRRAMKPRQIVESRFHAGYVAARLQPLSEEETENFHRQVEGLSGKLFRSITQTAERFFEESLARKNACRSAETLQRIRTKLDGLSFLDSSIAPLVGLIDRVLSHLPPKGAKIEGPVFWELTAVILVLCDRSRMQRAADGLFDLEESAKALAPNPALMDVPVPQAPIDTNAVGASEKVRRTARSPMPDGQAAPQEATLPFDFETNLERFFESNSKKPTESAVQASEALACKTESPLKEGGSGKLQAGGFAAFEEERSSSRRSGEAFVPADQTQPTAERPTDADEEIPSPLQEVHGISVPPAPPEELIGAAFCGAI